MCELVVAAADQEVDLAVGEDVLGLQQLAGVALVEEIVDAISVHPHAPRGRPGISHLLGDPEAHTYTTHKQTPYNRTVEVCAYLTE